MAVNCFSACLAIPLLKYFGRRKLLIFTFTLCSVLLVLMVIFSKKQTALLLLSISFVVMFEFGPGPIIWIYMSEVMNEKGIAVGTFINWTLTLIVGFGTTYLVNKINYFIFSVFATTCGIGLIFIVFFVKETKGLT